MQHAHSPGLPGGYAYRLKAGLIMRAQGKRFQPVSSRGQWLYVPSGVSDGEEEPLYFFPSRSSTSRAARQPFTWAEPMPCQAWDQLLAMNTFGTGVLLGIFCHWSGDM